MGSLLTLFPSANSPVDILGAPIRFWGNSQNVVLNASSVSQVSNLVSGNAHAVQGVAGLQPTLDVNILNGYPGITHDDPTFNLIATQAGITGNIYSAMVVSVIDYAGTSNKRILSYRNGSSNDFNNANGIAAILQDGTTSKLFSWYLSGAAGIPPSYLDVAQNTFYTIECLLDDTNNTISHWVNGVLVYNPAWAGTINSTNINIGDGQTANTLPMSWTELIVSLAAPSAIQQAAIRNFLRNKYRHY